MYTVIILNKRTVELLKEYKFLFKPFVDEGRIGFCNWNESGTDVRSSVPDLYPMVKGKKEWRAVILNTDSLYGYKDCPRPSEKNPFDYAALDPEPLPHESEIPLIRLTHILGGYNALPRKDFEKGFEYYDEEKGEMVRVRESELSEEMLQELSMEYDGVRAVYIEREIPKEVLERQKALSKKYFFADIRPLEIDLVATRRSVEDDDRALITESWKNHLEMNSSAFWERNKYPNICRFLYSELPNSENSLYKRALMAFWTSVLTLSINRVQASTLQAYRLYRLGVEISEDGLEAILNGHLNRLYSVYAFVKEQLQLRPEYSFEEDEALFTEQAIPVPIEMGDPDELYLDPHKLGLAKDCPEDEWAVWNSQRKKKTESLDKFLKGPRRSVDKAASFLKRKSAGFEGESYTLDKFQLDDLKDSMQELELSIITSEVKSSVDRKKLEEEMAGIDKEVKKTILYRMRRKTVLIAGGIALFLCLVGCLPYLISSGRAGARYLGSALLLVLGVLFTAAVGGVIALFLQRRRLVRLWRAFNDLMRRTVNTVGSYTARFERYFTDICTYMKAQSILDGIRQRKENAHTVANLLNAHRHALRVAMSRDEDLLFFFNASRKDEIVPNVTAFFRVNTIPHENPLYFLSPNQEEKDIPINATGDRVTSPYKFVERFYVERDDIFDEEEDGV